MLTPPLTSAPCMKRHPGNPVLSKKDVPYPADLIFNAGIAKYQGRYVMVFRNDYMEPGTSWPTNLYTNLGLAFSDDGIAWDVAPAPYLPLENVRTDEVSRIYDPRLTVIGDEVYLCFAMDTRHGLRGGIAKTTDFTDFEIISLSVPDNRNMVLFPEKIGGRYCRLERPMPVYSRGGKDRFDTWLSYSPDLRYWGDSQLVLAVEDVPYANDKTGPAAPPVKTKHGWLATYHGVDIDHTRGKNGWEDKWQKRYCAGIMLLDLDDPSKVLGNYQHPLLAPEAGREIEGGFRNHAIFPCGMILEDGGEVKIYYGAGDIETYLATAHVDDLVKLCLENK